MKVQTIKQFFKHFSSDSICLEHLMNKRYGLSGTCPKCSKETNYHRVSSQRAYVCQWCGIHIYPCVGTPFEKSRTSLQLWFYAIYLFTKTRSGVSSKELQRQLGVTYKCAWRMGHEIRKHMSYVNGDEKLYGDVEIDETIIGGRQEHSKARENKTILLGMLDRKGNVITKVVENKKWSTLIPVIAKNVIKGSSIYTDKHGSYIGLDKGGYKHSAVNHSHREYVNGDAHVNTIEGYWARLKQSIGGTHVHVSAKHLQKYADEFEYRFNYRLYPERMISDLLSTFQSVKK